MPPLAALLLGAATPLVTFAVVPENDPGNLFGPDFDKALTATLVGTVGGLALGAYGLGKGSRPALLGALGLFASSLVVREVFRTSHNELPRKAGGQP